MTPPPPTRPDAATPKRVLHVIDTLAGEGAQHVLANIVEGLDPGAFTSTVVATRAGGAVADALRRRGVPVTVLRRRKRTDLRPMRQLRRLIADHDIVHSHMFGSNASVAVAGIGIHTPIVAHDHNEVDGLDRLQRAVLRHVVGRRAACVFAVSPEVERSLVERGVRRSRVHLLENAVPPFERASRLDARRELGVDGDALVVGCIASLRPEKRHADLIRAMEIVRETHPDARLVLLGDGTERASIEALVDGLAMQDDVVLAGAMPDARRLLSAFDVFALASRSEGSPLSVLEAMVAGVPVVATDVGGISGLLEDQRGVRVAPADPIALAEALVRTLEDREAARARAERASVWLDRHRSSRAFITRIEQTYSSLA